MSEISRTAKDLLGNAVYYCMVIQPCVLQDTSTQHQTLKTD